MSFMLLGILNAQAAGGGAADFELLETQTLASAAASVTFSSIPADYKHLQIRIAAKTIRSDNTAAVLTMQFNADTGSNYSWHQLSGNGSSVGSAGLTSQTSMRAANITNSNAAFNSNNFGSGVIDILDFASTDKNTTIISLSGRTEANLVLLASGAWYNTDAITSIKLEQTGYDLLANSRFSLYGIKG